MIVSCAFCQKDVIRYQKIGKGGLIRLWVSRVIESEMPLVTEDKGLRCPFCEEQLGSRSVKDNEFVYLIRRGAVHTRKE